MRKIHFYPVSLAGRVRFFLLLLLLTLLAQRHVLSNDQPDGPPVTLSEAATQDLFPPMVLSERDRNALILNAYNEARGESDDGIRAVLQVTMARVYSGCFPDSVHDVVYQPYQFSWTHQSGTARSLDIAALREPEALQRVTAVVDQYLAEGAHPGTATLYHATYVMPGWAYSRQVERQEKIGSHIFYGNVNC